MNNRNEVGTTGNNRGTAAGRVRAVFFKDQIGRSLEATHLMRLNWVNVKYTEQHIVEAIKYGKEDVVYAGIVKAGVEDAYKVLLDSRASITALGAAIEEQIVRFEQFEGEAAWWDDVEDYLFHLQEIRSGLSNIRYTTRFALCGGEEAQVACSFVWFNREWYIGQ